MKKLLIVITFLVSSFSQAQKGSQEASLDVANGLIMQSLQVNYEYYLLDKSSVGMSALFSFAKRSSDLRYNEDSMITPFFRHYFTDARKWNYFGEVFIGINSGKEDYEENNIEKLRDYTDAALGVGGGLKYVSNGNIIITANAGVGRNLFSDYSPTIVPRAGLSVGYRF